MTKIIQERHLQEGAPRSKLLESLESGFRDVSTTAVMLHQAVAEHLGLHPTDHKCMGLLCERGPLSAGDLADLTGLTTGAITGVLNRLERAGFAKRVPNPEDRRNIWVLPQNVGRFKQRMQDLLGPLREKMAALTSKYSADELALVLDFIKASVAISLEEMTRLQTGFAGKASRSRRKNS